MEDFLQKESEELTEKFGKIVDMLFKWSLVTSAFIEVVKTNEEDYYPHKLEFAFTMFVDTLKKGSDLVEENEEGKVTDSQVYSFMFFINEKLQKPIADVETALNEMGVTPDTYGKSLNEKLREVMSQ